MPISETRLAELRADAKHAERLHMLAVRIEPSGLLALIDEIEALRKALKPFADQAKRISQAHLDGHVHDDDMVYVRYGDLCAARALTEGTAE